MSGGTAVCNPVENIFLNWQPFADVFFCDNNRRKNEILQSFNGEYTLNSTKDKIAIISLFIALGLVTHRQNSNAGVFVSVRLSCEILIIIIIITIMCNFYIAPFHAKCSERFTQLLPRQACAIQHHLNFLGSIRMSQEPKGRVHSTIWQDLSSAYGRVPILNTAGWTGVSRVK